MKRTSRNYRRRVPLRDNVRRLMFDMAGPVLAGIWYLFIYDESNPHRYDSFMMVLGIAGTVYALVGFIRRLKRQS